VVGVRSRGGGSGAEVLTGLGGVSWEGRTSGGSARGKRMVGNDRGGENEKKGSGVSGGRVLGERKGSAVGLEKQAERRTFSKRGRIVKTLKIGG